MNRFAKFAICGALALTAQTAAAVEHEVQIVQKGFYPETIHVEVGDTIRYINKTSNWVWLRSYDFEDGGNANGEATSYCNNSNAYSGNKDGWHIPWFYKNNERTVTVTSCMETEILSPFIWQYNHTNHNSSYYRGYISFSAPDLGQ